MKMKRALPYLFALLPIVLGSLVGWLSMGRGGAKNEWYKKLEKPAWTPPPAVFGPVWSVLYVMLGVASVPVFQAWQSGVPGAGAALLTFVASLAVNLAWTPTFFALQRPDIALALILVLLLSIFAMMVMFARVTRSRSWWLLVPYAVWVAYATTLNASIVHAASRD